MTQDAPPRASRLGAALLICGLVREPAVDAVVGASVTGLLTSTEWDAWRAGDETDRRLALACLEVEYGLRDQQWAALAALGDAWAAGTGPTPEDRIATMPAEAARSALQAVYALGWNFRAPDGSAEA